MLKKIKASEVQVGDLIKVDNTTYKIIKTDKGYNAVNIDCDNDYAETQDCNVTLEQYIKDWLYTWDEQIEFYHEEKEYTFAELLKLAETKNFEGIAKGGVCDYQIKFNYGLMWHKHLYDSQWERAIISIWWNNRTYKIDEDSIVELGRNILND